MSTPQRYFVQHQYGEWCIVDKKPGVNVTIAVGCPVGIGGAASGLAYAERIVQALNADTSHLQNTDCPACGFSYEVSIPPAASEQDATMQALHKAVDEAHALLFHYDLARQPNGVDWGPVEMLRQKAIDQLWSALEKAKGSS